LFALLKTQLKDSNDPRWKDVDMLWRGSSDVLSPEQCLALRVSLLQSKGQYKSQYDFLKTNNVHVFQCPTQLDKTETNFLPGAVEYSIICNEFFENKYKTPSPSDPINILGDFSSNFPEFLLPNCMVVRWSYADAIAKSLEELAEDIVFGLNNVNIDPADSSLLYITTIKDGGDGMGDMSVYKEKNDRFLPDKAFRFSFCLIKIEVVSPSGIFTVFEEKSPNSVRNNKPLLRIRVFGR